jgi:ADP-ribose pyrophosphatase
MKMNEKFLRRKAEIWGHAVGFRIDEVRLPNGKTAVREYIDHPGAVAVVPVLPNGRIVMVQQYRYPVQERTWELPAGKLGRGENPDRCVRRELQEETGYRAGRIKRLMSYWPTPAFANEVIHLYIATGLKRGRANPDDDEFLGTKAWKESDLMRAVWNGGIRDSKTLVGLFAYRLRREA